MAERGQPITIDEPRPTLRPREWDVYLRLAEDKDYTTIAAEIIISRDTVKFHVKNILRKFGVHSSDGAIFKGVFLGLLDLNSLLAEFDPSIINTLPSRQREILGTLTDLSLPNTSNRTIGSKLGISESTVRDHLKHTFNQLGVNGRTQAGLLYLQHTSKSVSLTQSTAS